MLAHSFQGEVFGPAQRLHGATDVVDATFRREQLDADGLVVDIGLASATLKAVLAELDFRNLDDEAAFSGENTTTEFLSRSVFHRLLAAIRDGRLAAAPAGRELLSLVLRASLAAGAAF